MDRHHWAVDLLRLTGAEHVLEIGCGPGMATVLVCDRPTTGRVTAIDRSDIALARATSRAAAFVSSGRLCLERSALADFGAPDSSFDAAFAINVNVFWTGAATAELNVLSRVLKTEGELHIVYETPWPEKADEVAGSVRARLSEHGFDRVAENRDESAYLSISGLAR